MATQEGILPIKGTIGNITFFKSKDGYRVKQKGGISASEIATSPAFKRTRENGAEFGRACKAGKVLRMAFGSFLQTMSDRHLVGRLVKQMMLVIHADLTSTRGQRNVIDGEAALLKDFDFNSNAVLGTCLRIKYETTIDRVTGIMTASFPDFVTEKNVYVPPGTTHFKLLLIGSAVDFENADYQTQSKASDFISVDELQVVAMELTVNLPANSTHPLFLALGMEFYQEVNGNKYPFNTGSFNALNIVKVDTGV